MEKDCTTQTVEREKERVNKTKTSVSTKLSIYDPVYRKGDPLRPIFRLPAIDGETYTELSDNQTVDIF